MPFTDSDGDVWLPDQGFEGGDTVVRDPTQAVAGTKDPVAFSSER
jgi:hypothetical protein